MYENNFPNKRYKHTLAFLQKHIDTSETILDLGVENPFSEIMKSNGYSVANTAGEDLDIDFERVAQSDADVVTAFEIFEHLIAPFNVLKEINTNKFDYVFVDGGHKYETVRDDLDCLTSVIKNNGTILCDDYNLTYAPGIKKAIDEFIINNNFNLRILNDRFAEIKEKSG
mgnify:CR=1 FL=1